MIPLRTAALYSTGLLGAFAAGWFLKPISAPETTGHGTNGGHRRTAPPTSLAGRPVGTAGETWLDIAAADAAAVRGAAKPGKPNPVLLEKLGAVLHVVNQAERQARWQTLLAMMRMEDARAIIALLKENLLEGRAFPAEVTAFWRQCGQMDPGTALKRAQEEGAQAVSDMLGGWACKDSMAAVAWLRDNVGRITSGPPLVKGLLDGLAAHSPEQAVRLLLAHDDDPLFTPCLGMTTDLIVQSGGIAIARYWFTELAHGNTPGQFKAASLEALLSYVGDRGKELEAPTRMDLAKTVAQYADEPWFSRSAANDLGEYMGELDPLAGAEVMEHFQNTEAKEYFTDSLLREWLSKDAGSVGEWLHRNQASPSFDNVAFQLAKYLSDEDPEAARKWADRISDPDKKEALEKELSKDQETVPEGAAVIQ